MPAVPAQTPPTSDLALPDPVVSPTYVEGRAGATSVVAYSVHHTDIVNGTVDLTGCGQFDHMLFLVTVHSITGTTPTITFSVNLFDEFANVYNVFTSAVINGPNVAIRGIGPGSDSVAPVPAHVSLSWAMGGTVTACSFDITVYGKID